MVDMSAIAGAMSSLNAAINITKAMKDLKDWSAVQTQVIELQRTILDAQTGLFSANEERATLIEAVSEAKNKIASLEAWQTEKQRYQLADIGDGNFAYALKEAMSNGEIPHYICANCYQDSKKSVLNHMDTGGGMHVVTCSKCAAKMAIQYEYRAPTYMQTEEDKSRAHLQRCPVCGTGRLKVLGIAPHPQLGPVGMQEMSLECDRCNHSEKRKHDPNKGR